MRIGQFADKYNITIDAIRHYMNIGLLTPLKKGGQFDFDSRAEDDIKMILEFKSHYFSLAEIKRIMLYKKITPLIYDNEDNFKKNIYINKIRSIEDEIKYLTKVVNSLNDKVACASKSTQQIRQAIGFPLEALDLFECPSCEGKLELNSSELIKGQVFQGELLCECGYRLSIRDGILVSESSRALGVSLYQNDLINYVDEVPSRYVNELHKASIWLGNIFTQNDYQSKVILDVGTGHGLFVKNIYKSLSENCLLICNDIYKEKIEFIKEILEISGLNRKVVFLACDARLLPLKTHCIDILSAVVTSIQLLKEDEILIERLDKYLKRFAEIYVGEMVFDTIDPANTLASTHRKELSKDFIDDLYYSNKFKEILQYRSSYLPFCGKYETLISEKDKVYLYYLYLVRGAKSI